MLYLRLQPGYEVKAKPGSMVAMDATVKLKGKLKFSVKKLFTGGEVRFCRRNVLLSRGLRSLTSCGRADGRIHLHWAR